MSENDLAVELSSGWHNAEITVRRAGLDDVRSLGWHFSEMQTHYGKPVSAATAHAAATLACQPVLSTFDPRVILALMKGAVVGSIVLNVTFPAFELTKSLYIRDLYVAGAARRRGVGQILVTAAARLTLAEGYSALDWTTETANMGARSMYEACGAKQLNRTYYRLADESLERYSQQALALDASVQASLDP